MLESYSLTNCVQLFNCFLFNFRPMPVPTEADVIVGEHDAGMTTQATLVDNITIEACSL